MQEAVTQMSKTSSYSQIPPKSKKKKKKKRKTEYVAIPAG